jgi:predicted amidohydrolase
MTTGARPLRAAVAQFAAVADAEQNLRVVEKLTAKAADQGAELVVFPEASMHAWDVPAAELAAAAERDADRFVDGLSALATRTGVELVAGLYAPEPGSRPRNRMVVVGADGTVRASYDKVHLFDAFSWRESDSVSAAPTRPDLSELCTVSVSGFTLGLLNCYDLRFPEQARALVDRGADVLVVSSAWVAGPHKEMHWELLLRARAVENTAYVLAADQPPPASAGLSMVVDPLGLVAATCLRTEDVAVHTLDPDHLRQVRATLPSLQHRRYRVVAGPPA